MHEADQQILDTFTACRNATLELARRIPDDLLGLSFDGDFAPTVAATLLHIADGPDWWMQHCMQDGRGRSAPPKATDRQTIIHQLQTSRDRLLQFFQCDDAVNMARSFRIVPEHGGDGPWTGRDRVLYLLAHEIHHRAKLVLVLRRAGFSNFPFFPF